MLALRCQRVGPAYDNVLSTLLNAEFRGTSYGKSHKGWEDIPAVYKRLFAQVPSAVWAISGKPAANQLPVCAGLNKSTCYALTPESRPSTRPGHCCIIYTEMQAPASIDVDHETWTGCWPACIWQLSSMLGRAYGVCMPPSRSSTSSGPLYMLQGTLQPICCGASRTAMGQQVSSLWPWSS